MYHFMFIIFNFSGGRPPDPTKKDSTLMTSRPTPPPYPLHFANPRSAHAMKVLKCINMLPFLPPILANLTYLESVSLNHPLFIPPSSLSGVIINSPPIRGICEAAG